LIIGNIEKPSMQTLRPSNRSEFACYRFVPVIVVITVEKNDYRTNGIYRVAITNEIRVVSRFSTCIHFSTCFHFYNNAIE